MVNSKLFYFLCSSFSCIGSLCFIMVESERESESEHEYRIFGAIYVILGVWLGIYFLLNRVVRVMLFSGLISGRMGGYLGFILLFVMVLAMVVGSFVLALFGVVLVVRGGVWVARVSVVLGIFLLVCYFGVMFFPFTFGSLQ